MLDEPPMNKIRVHVFLGLSLDGYIAGPNNELDWLNTFQTDPPEDAGFHDLLNKIDCLVMGRNTYDTVLPYGIWPYEGKRVVILTSREARSRYGESFYSGSLVDLFTQLEADGIKSVYLDGGKAVRQGLEANLVDELTLSWLPIILGKGIPLFTDSLPQSLWKLSSSRSFPSGLLQVTYVPLGD
jgi:dihydrofolate reductase